MAPLIQARQEARTMMALRKGLCICDCMLPLSQIGLVTVVFCLFIRAGEVITGSRSGEERHSDGTVEGRNGESKSCEFVDKKCHPSLFSFCTALLFLM